MNMRTLRFVGFLTAASVAVTSVVQASDVPALRPSAEAWLVNSSADLELSSPPAPTSSELDEVRALVNQRSAADIERILWWDAGGPAYRWNEIAIDAMLEDFVGSLLASRNLSLLHAAIDNAVAAAWTAKQATKRPRPNLVDPSIATALTVPESPSYPSDYAAAASAAAEVLGYLFPDRADVFAAKAEEAMRTRLLAGVEYPSDVAAGRAIGRKAAALAIARGKADGSDRKWTGSVPQGPGKWQGTEPVAPLAGTWRPWVLSRPDEFRPPAPPDIDSAEVEEALAELEDVRADPGGNSSRHLLGGIRRCSWLCALE